MSPSGRVIDKWRGIPQLKPMTTRIMEAAMMMLITLHDDSKHHICDSKRYICQPDDSKHSFYAFMPTVKKSYALGEHDP